MRAKIFLSFFAFLFVLAMAPAFAQDATAGVAPIDPAVVKIITEGGILGLSVLALTEMLKRLLKWTDALGYVASGIVSMAATAFYLITTSGFTILAFIGYSFFVFLTANGLYKVIAKTGGGTE